MEGRLRCDLTCTSALFKWHTQEAYSWALCCKFRPLGMLQSGLLGLINISGHGERADLCQSYMPYLLILTNVKHCAYPPCVLNLLQHLMAIPWPTLHPSQTFWKIRPDIFVIHFYNHTDRSNRKHNLHGRSNTDSKSFLTLVSHFIALQCKHYRSHNS